jgi:hypothetical protein
MNKKEKATNAQNAQTNPTPATTGIGNTSPFFLTNKKFSFALLRTLRLLDTKLNF